MRWQIKLKEKIFQRMKRVKYFRVKLLVDNVSTNEEIKEQFENIRHQVKVHSRP